MENNHSTISRGEYPIGSETKIDGKKQDLEVSESQVGDKYKIGPETKSEERGPSLRKNMSKPEIRVDTKKYGIGKPRRVILRGKLSHD